MTKSDCADSAFCNWAGGCHECRPDKWCRIDPELRGHHRSSSRNGASYEFARKALTAMAADFRRLADEIDAARAEGFRLYEIGDDGTAYLVKGRGPR